MHSVLRVIAGQQCPDGTIGRGDTNAGKARRDNQFYINCGSPATCDGMITSFSYCYHRPDRQKNMPDEYLITFALYRHEGGVRYSSVSQAIVLRKTRTAVMRRKLGPKTHFACSELSLDQPVTVHRGDVLGACVVNPSSDSVYRLDIAGRPGSGEASGNLLRAERAPAGCTETSVPSHIDFEMVTGDTTSTRVLHLSANIGRW